MNINQITLAWLNSVNGISGSSIEKLLDYFGNPEEIWYNFEDEKNNITMVKPEILESLVKRKVNFEYSLIKKLNEENARVTTFFDDDYPKKLRNINGAPYVLYYKGNLSCLDSLSIAVVGSRKATGYGLWAAEKFTRELSRLGVTIISGLAAGIDSAAHREAIKNNNRTIGVIGCGIDIVYPAKNEQLYEDIVEKDGCIVTEFPLGMAPMPGNFPVRNRIISGLSDGVLIIEAQEKSGTLITAGHAADQGKEIFAVPGNIDSLYSMGTNSLIRDGAKITTSVDDIIDEIIELKEKARQSKINKLDTMSEDEIRIMKCLESGKKTIYELNVETGLEASICLSLLTFLEMKGAVRQLQGNLFTLTNKFNEN
jgi:DNA processing protein